VLGSWPKHLHKRQGLEMKDKTFVDEFEFSARKNSIKEKNRD
jgi:hypothetical protein